MTSPEVLVTYIIIHSMTDGMPQGSPRVRVRIRRDRTEWAAGQRPVGSEYSGAPDVFWALLGIPPTEWELRLGKE